MGMHTNMRTSNATDIAKRVFDAEISALCAVRDSIGEVFDCILQEILNRKGKTVITGMGKSGHIGRKIAASLASLGNCAIFLHPGECVHGDLGMIQKGDVVIAISYSGESDEIIKIIPNINIIGAKLIGITGNAESTLAKNCAIVQTFPKFSEACLLGLAPTSSTTVALVYGDALAVAASEISGFGKDDYKKFHPSGSLGKSLTLRVSDCMSRAVTGVRLTETTTLDIAIAAVCETKWEVIPVYNIAGELTGSIESTKINAALRERCNIFEYPIKSMINYCPIFINIEEMAVDALRIMTKNDVDVMLVVNDDKAVGIIRRNDILKQGIYI